LFLKGLKMELFLQIVGGFIIAVILLGVAVFIYFKIKFGKYLGADTDQPPLYIHLNEDIDPDWLNAPAVKKTAKELSELGFTPGKPYFIHEMDGYQLQAFYKAPVVAVMYWHDVAGCWVDMVIEEIDGIEYTASNAPMGGEMSERPECVKAFDAKAKVVDLSNNIEAIIKESNKSFVEVNSENFRSYFESAFKKDIAWKNRKGGISYEEFIATEKEVSFNNSKEVIEEAFIDTKESELHQWHDAALKEYRDKENIEEDDFYDIEHRMLIVPFKSNGKAFIRYLSNYCFVNERQEEPLAKVYGNETDMQKLFNKVNDLLSPDLRASFVMDIDYPLPIKLYKLSDKMVD